jgi:hypothetical protein
VWNCKDHEGGHDYCLEVKGASRGPQLYISRRGWEIRELSDVDTFLSKFQTR